MACLPRRAFETRFSAGIADVPILTARELFAQLPELEFELFFGRALLSRL